MENIKKKFLPNLMPNDSMDVKDMVYPMIASYKLDGIRAIFKDGEMYSRSLKLIPNKQLNERFQYLKDFTKKYPIILDGELYSHQLTFQEIQHYVRTDDFTSERSQKKYGKIQKVPEHLKFYCFDMLKGINGENIPYETRLSHLKFHKDDLGTNVVVVKTKTINKADEASAFFHQALDDGYEGLILRNSKSKYKFGRVTAKSGDGYKLKPFVTIDAKIKEVVERTKAREGSEKKINELGRSVTSKKKADRIPCGIAAGFVVEYEGNELQATLTGNEAFRTEIWNNRKKYIGKYIEYRAMMIGAKDVPRHPTFIRFRQDKD